MGPSPTCSRATTAASSTVPSTACAGPRSAAAACSLLSQSGMLQYNLMVMFVALALVALGFYFLG